MIPDLNLCAIFDIVDPLEGALPIADIMASRAHFLPSEGDTFLDSATVPQSKVDHVQSDSGPRGGLP